MAALPFEVHFVVRYADKWRELIDARPGSESLTVDDVFDRIVSNEDCWIVSTFLHLRRRVGNVRLVDRVANDSLCVVSGLDFGVRDAKADAFFVATRSDGPDPALGHWSVVQNPAQLGPRRVTHVPHWPQPALLPRSEDRGPRIEHVDFFGSECNLDDRFRSPPFRAALARGGATLRIHASSDGRSAAWNDYRSADLVLAARNLTVGDASTKPASKLINAWQAGVPALLGPEPAFQGLRRSELDYFEVTTPEDALGALARLRADPGLYGAVVRNGRQRAAEFSTDAIAARWIEMLSGPVATAYAAWAEAAPWQRALRLPARIARHKLARLRAERLRHHGARILDVA